MGGELIIETTSTSTTCVFSLMCKLIPLKSANIVALCMSVMITLTKPGVGLIACQTNGRYFCNSIGAEITHVKHVSDCVLSSIS